MSENTEQLFLDFNMADDAQTVRSEQIADPVDGSLFPEESASSDLFSVPSEPEPFALPPPEPEPEEPEPEIILSRRDLQRAALAWLASRNPTAAAIRVPTRLARFRADAAAFWSTPRKRRLLRPELTVLVEVRQNRSECFPACSRSEIILPQYCGIQEQKRRLEAEIRRTEPWLLDSDVLFPEIEIWDYSRSTNPEYAETLAKLAEYESMIYRGSTFERIRSGNVADELYLAVPEGVIAPDEIAGSWGLLEILPDLSIRIVKKAEQLPCPDENRLHLSQNIAASSLHDVMFAHGINMEPDGSLTFRRPPKMRPKLQFHLN